MMADAGACRFTVSPIPILFLYYILVCFVIIGVAVLTDKYGSSDCDQSYNRLLQAGMAANPARGELDREKMNISLSPFAPEKLVSRDRLGRPVPRQPAHFPHSGRI